MKKTILYVIILAVGGISCAKENVSFITSFEDLPKGEFTVLETDFGIWKAPKGSAELSSHFKTGKQCLHIFGGEKQAVEFTPETLCQVGCIA